MEVTTVSLKGQYVGVEAIQVLVNYTITNTFNPLSHMIFLRIENMKDCILTRI